MSEAEWLEEGGDCDDADPMTYPSASEICDGVVNDCSGGNRPSTETDNDGDGYVECVSDDSVGMDHHRLLVVGTVGF